MDRKPNRRWLTFSIRALLVLIAAVAVCLGVQLTNSGGVVVTIFLIAVALISTDVIGR